MHVMLVVVGLSNRFLASSYFVADCLVKCGPETFVWQKFEYFVDRQHWSRS